MKDDEIQDAELRQAAQRLGIGAGERLDVERAVAGVVGRLRTEPVSRPQRSWWIGPAWLRVAAAVALVIGAGIVMRAWRAHSAGPHAAHYVADDLQDLTTDQLRQVLGSLDETLTAPVVESGDDDWNDLTTEELQALLRSMEG
jgi:hypothetical protein